MSPEELKFLVDNLWVLLAGVLVFFMQAGFALVEAGMTRAKNVSNIMAKNMADMAIGTLAFFAIGYTLAYGGDGSIIGGFGNAFLSDATKAGGLFDATAGLTPATDFFFQAVFAATAVTIASGAMAERTKFSGYLAFSLLMTAFIYPLVVHWTWGGGLIADISIGDAVYSDFAGSGIVHMTGGVAALVGAIFLGPRIGKFAADGTPRAITAHSIPFAVLGMFILFFGWFGFNPGSQLAADSNIAFLALNTLLAGAAGMVSASAYMWRKSGSPDVGMACNGALAGLVSITAPVGAVMPWEAVIIGLVGGILVVAVVFAIESRGIDDPVGAVAVHGAGGLWGLLSIGLFAYYDDGFLGRSEAGLFHGGGVEQLLMQMTMALIIIAFVAVASTISFAIIKATVGLRVSEEEELDGLDVAEHGTSGYGTDAMVGHSA